MSRAIPSRNELMEPTLEALKELGGSGDTDEIYEKIVENLKLNDSLLEITNGKTGQSALKYDLAWVRTVLKNQGRIANVGRGLWVLNIDGTKTNKNLKEHELKQAEEELEDSEKWKSNAIRVITEQLSPNAFERLVQRILREKGFTQVEVTGKTGDGGIDGKGVAKINGMLSFYIIFQCKRIKGKVSASQIRDFRGSMIGRTDKGLFITTGSYTRDAIREASRDGAPAIDLIDGEKLVEKLKELSLGIKIEMKEHITVDEKWFKNF